MQDICKCRVIHEQVVEKSLENALEDQEVEALANLYKAYADPSRLRILYALERFEMCVCDLAAMLSISESAVSHQLRLLRNMRLVKNRRDGNILYYTLYDKHCITLLKTGLQHLDEQRR